MTYCGDYEKRSGYNHGAYTPCLRGWRGQSRHDGGGRVGVEVVHPLGSCRGYLTLPVIVTVPPSVYTSVPLARSFLEIYRCSSFIPCLNLCDDTSGNVGAG